MTALPPATLIERQVELVRVALDHQAGMQAHLKARVLPHLGTALRAAPILLLVHAALLFR